MRNARTPQISNLLQFGDEILAPLCSDETLVCIGVIALLMKVFIMNHAIMPC